MTISLVRRTISRRLLSPGFQSGVSISHETKTMLLTTYLNPQQIAALQAAVIRVIPKDDFPDGWEAGSGDFFAQLFAYEPRFLPTYQQGLDALDAEAHAVSGQALSQMDTEAQDALLTRVEAGEVQTDWLLDPAEFFRLLVAQTLEGFYADPGNGGNKDGVSWRMIGFTVTA
ncbi:MAG: gluconate 2-dehydrogenase subunit 3 family protein [Janthinobacterium lividum]